MADICLGDFMEDGDADGNDLAQVIEHYGSSSDFGAFNLSGAENVNEDDLATFALHCGKNNCD